MAATAAPSRSERQESGKARRQHVPRASHAAWEAPKNRPDPVALIAESSRGRVAELLPTRYERMAASPFAFFRGSALVMATDLATTPVTGLTTQICGDAHCANFGGFTTPGGSLIFDVNDFDETLPGPWEWDLKRLATSLVLAARTSGLHSGDAAVLAAVRAYRERMIACTAMTTLEIWTDRVDASPVVAMTAATDAKRMQQRLAAGSRPHWMQHRFYKLTELVDGHRRIVDELPNVFHPAGALAAEFAGIEELLPHYRRGLRDDIRALVERYRFADWVVKVVGVGSVGTRCVAALFLADAEDPLILQLKEATTSVLERFVGASRYANHGERVVAGQRLMQSGSDPFLGWTGSGDRCYYVRQLRVVKGAPEIEALDAQQLATYAHWCGVALAAAHARSGDPHGIAGYLGNSDAFDRAMSSFASAYADQMERDFSRFAAALKDGTLDAPALQAIEKR